MNSYVDRIAEICGDYKLEPEDLRTAAIAELLSPDSKKLGPQNIKDMLGGLSQVLSSDEIINTIRWATYVKKTREELGHPIEVAALISLQGVRP